jgi:hypothetical protein
MEGDSHMVMAHDDDSIPLDALFQKIKFQWNVTLTDSATEGQDGDRGGDRDDRSTTSTERLAEDECFVLLVQHSLGSNLRILSSGGYGVGSGSERHGDQSSDRISSFNGRKTNVASSDVLACATMTDAPTSPTLYERAGVRSPPEMAWRDLHGSSAWIENIVQILGVASDFVLWVQTLPVRGGHNITPRMHNVETMNLTQDPFGWDAEAEEEITGNNPDMENLDRIVTAIKDRVHALSMQSKTQHVPRTHAPSRHSRGFVPVVLQSITPITHRHGFARTMQFLHELQRCCCPVLVVPVSVESLSPDQHWSLEGMGSAVLAIEDGGAVMLRRGVRERTNVVRETLELDFDDPWNSTGFSSTLASQSTRTHRTPRVRRVASSAAAASTLERPEIIKDVTHGATTNPQGPPPGKTQIQLSISDDDTPRASWRSGRTASNEPLRSTPFEERKQPNIIVQDDDPEFDDYDEEDPDDDLDL